MFLASSLELVMACCREGVIGAFPANTVRRPEVLADWLSALQEAERVASGEGHRFAPFIVNVLGSAARDKGAQQANLRACAQAEVPLLLTNMGSPAEVVRAAHDWGALVFHDVTTVTFARKAIDAGVDGLMVLCGGGGGHAGTLNPFAFLPQVRELFAGPIMLAGGIATGTGIAAALTLGADLVVMGTRFIATVEAGAPDGHKEMLVRSSSEDVTFTSDVAGLPGSFLLPSMRASGVAPGGGGLPPGIRAWRDVWSAGHSVGLVSDAPPVSAIVERLDIELSRSGLGIDWRRRLSDRLPTGGGSARISTSR